MGLATENSDGTSKNQPRGGQSHVQGIETERPGFDQQRTRGARHGRTAVRRPRDLNSGRESLPEDDRGSGTGPVAGAFGSAADKANPAGSSGDETVGVAGDRAFDDVQRARRGK
jgi:hypothetical protein